MYNYLVWIFLFTIISTARSHPEDKIYCSCNSSFTLVTKGSGGIHRTNPQKDSVDSPATLDAISKRLGLVLRASAGGYKNFLSPHPIEAFTGPLPHTQENGWDPACQNRSKFTSTDSWFRDHYKSALCNSQPRERAMGFVLHNFLREWTKGVVHESSPNSGFSNYLRSILGDRYFESQFSATTPCGDTFTAGGLNHISVNLENQNCIENEKFDIVITQDVFEHVFDAAAAFREIGRTLKPGGYHVFTTPLVAKNNPTFVKAEFNKSEGVVYLHDSPDIHGNPVQNGSLMTIAWGYDIVEFIEKHTGMKSQLIHLTSRHMGVEYAEFREVIISRKSGKHAFLRPKVMDMCGNTFITCTEKAHGRKGKGRINHGK